MKPDIYQERLKRLMRHINGVRENCLVLAEAIIKEDDNIGLAHELMINAQVHDHSKLKGIEWEYLHDEVKESDPEKFKLAHYQHITTNRHHPEFWSGGIDEMPPVYLAEFVCDTYTRSAEFGTDFREWIKSDASKKFKFSVKGQTYKRMKHFMDLLLDTPFK